MLKSTLFERGSRLPPEKLNLCAERFKSRSIARFAHSRSLRQRVQKSPISKQRYPIAAAGGRDHDCRHFQTRRLALHMALPAAQPGRSEEHTSELQSHA